MAIEPAIHDPDWGRFAISAPTDGAPVGDPTRWGAQVQTILPTADVDRLILTQQIINVGTQDGYSRSWALLGTLGLPITAWSAPMAIDLEIVMGVGQVQILQRIALKRGGADPFRGLCYSQHEYNGGPYPHMTTYFPTGVAEEVRSFAIIGGLIGQMITVRGVYSYSVGTAGVAGNSRLAAIVTPYAAGEGL